MVLWITCSRLLFVPMPHAYLTNKFHIYNSWSSLPNIYWKKILPSKILQPWILELEDIRKLILSLNKLVGGKDLENMWALYIVGGMSLPPKILKSQLLRESWFIPAASYCVSSLRHQKNPKNIPKVSRNKGLQILEGWWERNLLQNPKTCLNTNIQAYHHISTHLNTW